MLKYVLLIVGSGCKCNYTSLNLLQTFELHFQPQPTIINTYFSVNNLLFYVVLIILIFDKFSKRSIKAP
jgi:hypothetical protein